MGINDVGHPSIKLMLWRQILSSAVRIVMSSERRTLDNPTYMHPFIVALVVPFGIKVTGMRQHKAQMTDFEEYPKKLKDLSSFLHFGIDNLYK